MFSLSLLFGDLFGDGFIATYFDCAQIVDQHFDMLHNFIDWFIRLRFFPPFWWFLTFLLNVLRILKQTLSTGLYLSISCFCLKRIMSSGITWWNKKLKMKVLKSFGSLIHAYVRWYNSFSKSKICGSGKTLKMWKLHLSKWKRNKIIVQNQSRSFFVWTKSHTLMG